MAIFVHMEQLIFETLTKVGVNPTTAILAVLLWMVRKQQTLLETLITSYNTEKRETKDSIDNLATMIRRLSDGGGSLTRDQAIRLFYRLVDSYCFRLQVETDTKLNKRRASIEYNEIRTAIVDKFHDEFRRFIADFRTFEYQHRPITDFVQSIDRRWQYMIDETVNRVWLYNLGEPVDADFEAYFDRFRSQLHGSFNIWLDSQTLDIETFEREFEARSRMQAGKIEFLKDMPNA